MTPENDLRRAFPAMPEDCRAAYLQAVRSVKEENKMKRKTPVALIVFAIVLMITTVAIAEGWNVLQYLDITPGSGIDGLVQPVSASAKDGDVSFAIEQAITDGEYLVFDWTVDSQGDKAAFFQLESYTANGVGIYNESMADDFDCIWHDDMMQGGTFSTLPANLEGDTLHVEMVIGAYTPINPIYEMPKDGDFDAVLAKEKLDAGYFVRYGFKAWVIDDPVKGIFTGWHKIQDAAAEGFTRNELALSFDLDLKAGRATVRELELPEPVTVQGVTFAFTRATVSSLKLHLTTELTSAAGNSDLIRDIIYAHSSTVILNVEGTQLRPWDLCAFVVSGSEDGWSQNADGTYRIVNDSIYFNPNDLMPDPFVKSFRLDAGQLDAFPEGLRIDLPIRLK